MRKLVGLGNALVDVLALLPSDEVLEEIGLSKGLMTPVDGERLKVVKDAIAKLDCTQCAGGCSANAVRTYASLGGQAGFIGSIGDDAYGDFFEESLKKAGIQSHLSIFPGEATGFASTFISKDGERTFGTFYGAASNFDKETLVDDMLKGYAFILIEGYLAYNKELMLAAMQKARQAGVMVCLDLASGNVVTENRDFFKLLLDEYVDVVFANENEASAMTGKEPLEAARELSDYCKVAVVKVGEKGSIIACEGQSAEIDAVRPKQVLDTTGAGDCYAAGFLYGLSRGCNLSVSGRIASLVAAAVIQVVGTVIPESEMKIVRMIIDSMI